ncbi:MAG: hypothetical protein Q9198_006076 [Flavoplaca austrocitrina]
MSTFTALNIEPESDTEDEVDNTKEIQIEEALKLYQNALKLHSQGPQFFDQAEEAYQALFSSEVFTYLESLSEAQRVSYYENTAATSTRFEDEFPIETVAGASGADGTPSTLPQILYLSYKNNGHFLLDRLKHRLQAGWYQALDQDQIKHAQKDILETIKSSLSLLVEALDRDDTDLELWRQLSKIGESLGSTRLARFCLEVIVDRDDISPDAWPEPLGLQEIFASERLKSLLQNIDDDQSSAPSLDRKQFGLIQTFKTQMDPLPYLPSPPPVSPSVKHGDSVPPLAVEQQQLLVPLRTWSSCGKAILIQRQKEEQGFSGIPAGAGYCLILPPSNQVIHPKLDLQAPESPGLTSPKTGINVEELHGYDNSSQFLPQYDVAFEKPRASPLVPPERLSESTTSVVLDKISGITSPLQSAQKANGELPYPQEIEKTSADQEASASKHGHLLRNQVRVKMLQPGN